MYTTAVGAEAHILAGALTHTAAGQAVYKMAAYLLHRPYTEKEPPTQWVHTQDGSLAQLPAPLLHALHT